MAELMRVVCIGTVMLMLSGGAMGYYRDGGLEEAVEQIEAVPPDIDTAAYLLPKLSHNYIPYAPQSSNGLWKHVTDPSLYVLTETDSDAKSETKSKRSRNGFAGSGPSLSIVNPLDVLRQRLLLEIARRRMRQSENQIQANRELLKSIGKRSFNGFSSGHSHTFEQDRPEADHADRAKKPEQERDSIDGEQQIGRDLDRWNRHHAIHGENA